MERSFTYELTITPAWEWVEVIEAGETKTFDFSDRELPMTEITITVAERVVDVLVSVEVLVGKPAEAPALELPVFSYFNLKTNVDAYIREARVKFKSRGLGSSKTESMSGRSAC